MPARAPYGINIPPNTYYSNGLEWVDVGRTLRPWAAGPPSWTAPVVAAPTTPAGYPTAPAWTYCNLAGQPAGTYRLAFAGTATIAASGRAGKLGPAFRGSDGVSRADLVLTGTAGALVLAATGGLAPADPLRDLRLYRPGYPATGPPTWTLDFLRRLSPFSCLRVMDWACANRTAQSAWADRVLPGDFLQVGPDGLAIEYMIELANTAGADLWLTIPDGATDDYVASMAYLVDTTLDTNLHVYIEYSNEVWNSAFPQWGRNDAAAKLDRGSFPTPGLAGPQRYALRAHEMAATWRAASWGDTRGRIRPVLAGQCASPWWLSTGLAYLASKGVDVAEDFYGIAVAPYFWPTAPVNADPAASLDALFADLSGQLGGPVAKGIASHAALARSFGVALLGYEAGQSLVANIPGTGPGTGVVNLANKLAAQADPRMGQLYRSLATIWAAAGGGLLNWYCGPAGPPSDKYGNFALLPSAGASGSVKWDAVRALAGVPGDCNLDGVTDYADWLQARANLGRAGCWFEDGVLIDADGTGTVTAADLAAIAAAGTFTDGQRAAMVALGAVP